MAYKKTELEIAAEKEAVKQYKAALDGIRKEISLFFEKYERNGRLTYAEANKYNRLIALEKSITQKIKALGTAVNTVNYKYASIAYQNAYYRQAYEIEMAVKRDLGYSALSKAVIAASIYSLISGASVKDRIAKNVSDLNFNLKSSLIRGLVDGRGYAAIAREVKSLFNNDVFTATRVVNTEIHRNSVEAKTMAMAQSEESGVEIKKVWVATLDGRTRHTHGKLDGEEVDLKDNFEWIAADGSKVSAAGPGMSGNAGEDINCRCTVVERVNGIKPGSRRAGQETIPYMTYKEWQELHKVAA